VCARGRNRWCAGGSGCSASGVLPITTRHDGASGAEDDSEDRGRASSRRARICRGASFRKHCERSIGTARCAGPRKSSPWGVLEQVSQAICDGLGGWAVRCAARCGFGRSPPAALPRTAGRSTPSTFCSRFDETSVGIADRTRRPTPFPTLDLEGRPRALPHTPSTDFRPPAPQATCQFAGT